MLKYILSLFCIVLIFSCKSPQQKAYETALSSGVQLTPSETTNAVVGDKLLYVYQFSAGVEDIYYKLAYVNSDPGVLEYENNLEFYLGAQDVDGGPSAGIHVFKALKEGQVKLNFYNVNENEENLKADTLNTGATVHPKTVITTCHINVSK